MYISILELLKTGIGPSSSHTMGPMLSAVEFRRQMAEHLPDADTRSLSIRCVLKGSLAFTGKGHATDKAVVLGLHGYRPEDLVDKNVAELTDALLALNELELDSGRAIRFTPASDIVFNRDETPAEHPNGMTFEVIDAAGDVLLSETYFSIGGGFIKTLDDMTMNEADDVDATGSDAEAFPYPFDSADAMMTMSARDNITIADMKLANELKRYDEAVLYARIDGIWNAMKNCVENGLAAEGILPGGLNLKRRAHALHETLTTNPGAADLNDWLCAYAMAVNEENAAGHMVVTAPTNGAAGVIPAVLYEQYRHNGADNDAIRRFLLVAAAIGGLIKHNSSISGAEVGCQGEVGSAAAMAAAGLCAIRGGSTRQIENAAEIALEHHLGMTCDPVGGLVQVPCIERNGFGAINAHTAASLALRGTGEHFMSLDKCISAMKQTGLEMSAKYKETSLGGLAVSFTEC